MKLILISHGLKTAQGGRVVVDRQGDLVDWENFIIPRADIYIDCRVLKEPQENNPALMRYFQPLTLDRIEGMIRDGLALIDTRRLNSPGKVGSPVIICFLCAWGKNRSVTCKGIMRERLSQYNEVEVP